MEHNAIQWLGAPSCQRGSYAFYKSVSSRAQPDGPAQVWKLGEFYFIRCGPQDPVCVAEVTLLWEDQTRRHLLASARLYFLPEDTPKGRTREHGEDEVLAVSRKMVVRVEDLVRWSCAQPAGWSSSLKTAPCGTNGLHKPPQCGDGTTDKSSEPLKDKTENGPAEHHAVKVISYPQYCRFRSLQRRIQDGAKGSALQDPHLLALGGIKVTPNTRVMYCRDTFNHPTLESSSSFSWQFRCPSLSLRGRPRKRRGRDSKDLPNSSQSESWIERMKENVMGSVEVGCDGGWLPHPEEQLFLDQLFAFMDRHGSPIHKVPNLGFKKIDLFLMYSVVKRLGGYKKSEESKNQEAADGDSQVTTDRLWKVVYNELGGCPGSTSAATCTRRHYERLMLPYEEHLRAGGAEFKVPETPVVPKPRGIRGRRPHPRGRKPGPRPRERKVTTPPAAAVSPTVHDDLVNPNGTAVAKRGRGRPPGTRNKATLLAQAKLLALQQAKVKGSAAETTQQQLPAVGRGGLIASGVHRPIQPAILPITMPLTPDLAPLAGPFVSFQPKPKEVKPDRGESVVPTTGVLLSPLPRHFVGGSLSGFSPIKGVCPLDVFKSPLGTQRGPESPALTPQDPSQHHSTIYTLQLKSGSPDTPHPSGEQLQPQPHPLQQHHTHCSGCNMDEGGQRGGGREARTRPPPPPLRVLPLNLDCRVQVCQLMRTHRLDPSQLQTFRRRLSEALSQDLSTKPVPPPEQALPLNLSKRFTPKRPAEGPEPSRAVVNGNADQLPPKRPRTGFTEPAEATRSSSSGSAAGGAAVVGGGGQVEVEIKNQDEPADLSSPSRIRAFLLGLPPFQVKLEEDLNGVRFGKFVPKGESGEAPLKDVKKEEEEEVAVEKTEVEARDRADSSSHSAVNANTQCF